MKRGAPDSWPPRRNRGCEERPRKEPADTTHPVRGVTTTNPRAKRCGCVPVNRRTRARTRTGCIESFGGEPSSHAVALARSSTCAAQTQSQTRAENLAVAPPVTPVSASVEVRTHAPMELNLPMERAQLQCARAGQKLNVRCRFSVVVCSGRAQFQGAHTAP